MPRKKQLALYMFNSKGEMGLVVLKSYNVYFLTSPSGTLS